MHCIKINGHCIAVFEVKYFVKLIANLTQSVAITQSNTPWLYSMATAKAICQSVPQVYLDLTVSYEHIAELAKDMTKWRELAPFLKLTPTEEEEIVEQHQQDLPLQKREALRKWKEKSGGAATYQRLIVIFCAQSRADLANKLKDLNSLNK